MKITTILKCIFIPFYLYSYREKKRVPNEDLMPGMIYGVILSGYILFRLILGINQANDVGQCRMQSIGDLIVTPMYALGCNIGKDRFDISLN